MNRLKTSLSLPSYMLGVGLYLLGCGHTTTEPVPSRKLESARSAQATVAPATVPLGKSAAKIEAEIRNALPDVENYQELSTLESDSWIGGGGELWLAANDMCRPVQIEGSDSIDANVELCRRKRGQTTTTCSYLFTLVQGALRGGSISCENSRNQRVGEGWGSGGPEQTLSLQSSDASSQVYGETWRLWVESDRHVVQQQPCTKGSADKARERVVQESPELDPDQELQRRFGVIGQTRRCHLTEGLRLVARAENDRGSYDRGALGRIGSEPVDCRSACPVSPNLTRIQEMNSWFDGKHFEKTAAPKATISLHPTKEHCQAVVGKRTGSIPKSDCKPPKQ